VVDLWNGLGIFFGIFIPNYNEYYLNIIDKLNKDMLKWFAISVGVTLPYIFGFLGLSTMGPIAGGFFSTMQGSGIVAGSIMALTQSFVMCGWAITIQTYTICFCGVWYLIKKFYNYK
jgi:hypothetical protein